jgi:hypothetical protein
MSNGSENRLLLYRKGAAIPTHFYQTGADEKERFFLRTALKYSIIVEEDRALTLVNKMWITYLTHTFPAIPIQNRRC